MTRVAWIDCSSGVAGDMLAAALSDLGALDGLPALLDSLGGLATVSTGATTRHGQAATTFTVTTAGEQPPRRLAAVLGVIERADAPDEVLARATSTFTRLAAAEAAVHGIEPDEVHFHEVGAVDAIVDVLVGCLGFAALDVDRVVASPIALGGGTVTSDHGQLPIPGPAVLRLLAGCELASYGGPVDVELATPTGVALLAELAEVAGRMPAMTVERVGAGAGSRVIDDLPNLLRVVVGETAEVAPDASWLVVEANVDDLDPRLWPGVLERLLGAGAADAWLTPILMKKGRPAHTVSALTTQDRFDDIRRVLVTETSTIGVRHTAVGKHALDRQWVVVHVSGQAVRVKLALDGGVVRNVAPEFDDVAAAAAALGVPVKDVLARAAAAAWAELT